MTVTPLASFRMTLQRCLAYGVAAMITLLMVTTGWAPAAAATGDAASTTSPSAELTVLAGTNGTVAPGNAVTIWVTLDNPTDQPVPATSVSVSIRQQPVTNRGALADWTERVTEVPDTTPWLAATLPDVAADTTETVPIRISATDPILKALNPGVYAITATAATTPNTVTAVGTLTVAKETPKTRTVGIVVPITAGPLSTGLLTSEELSALTAPDGALTALLDAVDGSTVTLAVDPAIPAAIRVRGTAAPVSATQWLERLLALPNPRFALQFGDADVSAQLSGGRDELLQPESLGAWFDQATATDASPSPAPADTPTPVPDVAELTDVAPTMPPVFWAPTGTATTAMVQTLATLDETGTTLVDSAATAAGANGGAVPAAGTVGSTRVLVYDTALSRTLRAATGELSTSALGAALANLRAQVALATGAGPLLIVADRAGLPVNGAGLAAALTVLGGITTVQPVSTLIGATPAPITLAKDTTDPAAQELLDTLRDDETLLDDFSAVLDDPSLLIGRERAEILQLLGCAWRTTPALRDEAVAAHRDATRNTLNAISIVPTTDLTIISSGVDLRFWVRNDLPWPATVVLTAQPGDARLLVQAQTVVSASAASNTRVTVPVEARVGSGESTLMLQLRSKSFQAIGPTQKVAVSVRADWENVGVIVLGVVIVGLLGLGIFRTVRRRRSATALDGESDA